MSLHIVHQGIVLVPHEHYLLNMLNFLGEEAKEAARTKSAAKQLEK